MIIDPYAWSTLTITSIKKITTDTVAVKTEKPLGYDFFSGQYAVIRSGDHSSASFLRQYSFASSPSEGHLEFLIQREPGGVASTWFFEHARTGDTLSISQALGTFIVKKDAPALLIAGRAGIAPFISFIRTEPRRSADVLYSVREKSQVCYPKLVTDFGGQVIVTSETGRIQKAGLQPYIAKGHMFYVCGSKQFVDGITETLISAGALHERIRRELFTLQ